MTLDPDAYTPEQVRRERHGFSSPPGSALTVPLNMAALGCICSYTWSSNGAPVRNGPMASCTADHSGAQAPGDAQRARTLEERIAALEAMIAHPLAAIEVPESWTEEQAEEFRAEFGRLTVRPDIHWLSSALTADGTEIEAETAADTGAA